MVQEGLETIEYGHDPVACILADSETGADRMGRDAERAGFRVARRLRIGVDDPGECVPGAAALVDCDGSAGQGAVDALLDWSRSEARNGRRRIVVSVSTAVIDAAFAALGELPVPLLCGANVADRAYALAVAGRPLPDRFEDGRNPGPAILQQLTEDVSRIAAILSSLSDEETASLLAVKAQSGEVERGEEVDAPYIRAIIRTRRLRDQFFRADLFADPAWDMLLDLMAARLEGKRVAVSSLCIAAAVPATTALRWIKALTDRGLLQRAADPNDGRRVYIELSDEAARLMSAYLRSAQRISPALI